MTPLEERHKNECRNNEQFFLQREPAALNGEDSNSFLSTCNKITARFKDKT